MFKTILWATDGSETAARGLPYAIRLAKHEQARLVVAHVREILAGRGGGYPVLADEDELRARLRGQVEELRQEGLEATLVLRTCTQGHVPRTLTGIARDEAADLVVLGTHGYGRFAGLVVGSVTQGLLHSGSCPVLAIPAGAPVEEPKADLAGVA
jgi:nucleotide-binding universal stress UspA family protein